ncbi:hypothetical protein GTY65_39910 [Streptomyces sp. SID8379]|uniref:hypothetical protein n=1 Tax=unclassified Streptomyces TaxID=2593676 RepID=UPI001319CC95|nr:MULTISPECIES: hypothetical protein [unclassified Streptomyces]MYW70176.1 hypothetical protein [Streptomyces sp. SID8379]
MGFWVGFALIIFVVPLGAFVARWLEDAGKKSRARTAVVVGYWSVLAVAVGLVVRGWGA